jgi:hypothetical protein
MDTHYKFVIMTITPNGEPALWNGSAIPTSRPAINVPTLTTRKKDSRQNPIARRLIGGSTSQMAWGLYQTCRRRSLPKAEKA